MIFMIDEFENGFESVENTGITEKFEKFEKILLLIAFFTAVLCDRLIFDIWICDTKNIFYFTAIFEICFIVIFCVLNYGKIRANPYLWVVAVLIVSLCVWNFIFDYQSSYGILTFIVIPASLLMFSQLASENLNLKNITGMIISWFASWIIKPFIAIKKCIKVFWETIFPQNGNTKSIIKKSAFAALITIPLITALISLLSGADKVFGYYTGKIFALFDIYDIFWHSFLVILGFLIFYSFFWQSRYGKTNNYFEKTKKEYKADKLILYIILCPVLFIYILFCAVQFAYLFASAGLPDGISYSEYAREGFMQIVIVSGINLLILGCMVKYGNIHKTEKNPKDPVLAVMLFILIIITGIMLISGFKRLGLYIDEFGMTFLRLISAWFMIYLTLVLILCTARLIWEKIPLVVCCAVLLLACYNILGYINPDAFIIDYNLNIAGGYHNINQWTEENFDYVFFNLSDDAINELIKNNLDREKYSGILKIRYEKSLDKHSMANVKLRDNY